jgi:agmatine/peptidylarginine deiminase
VAEMSEDCNVLTVVANVSEQQQVINQYQAAGVNMDNCEWLFAQSDSYWTRDYGPWFVVDGNHDVGICNFPYNRPRPNDNDIPIAVANYLDIELYGMDLLHTGGNWMCDGWNNGASTDLVWEENTSLSHDAIDALVESYLGIERHHVLPDPLDDYIKHIDCWGKFLDVDKVLIGQVPVWDYRYDDFEYVANYFGIRNSAYGTPYQVFRVFTPGDHPNTPYTNSLILNKKVFVPITGSQYDDEALAVYEEAMPGYEVIGVMHTTWENTDALHCRTKGIADIGMLYMRHKPLLGGKDFDLNYTLEADIIPYSGSSAKPDSTFIYYMIDSISYESMLLEREGSTNTWSATLPFLEPGTEVAYYLHTRDYTGRMMEHPYIGQPDAHIFTVKHATDAVTLPDSLEYETYEQCAEGQSFEIYNFMDGDLVIENMELENYGVFGWNVKNPPTLPYTMAYGDTLEIIVLVSFPVSQPSGWAVDTLNFTTANGSHGVLLKVNEDLLTNVGTSEMSGPQLKVYPNPFNESTVIDINLESSKSVRIDILTLDGKLIETVSNSNLSEGSHQIRWNASRFNNGIYLVRVNVEGKVSLQKVVKMD